jgi:hypothetical protein
VRSRAPPATASEINVAARAAAVVPLMSSSGVKGEHQRAVRDRPAALNAVEGDHRQPELRGAHHLRMPRQAAQHDQIRVLRRRGPRQTDEVELAVELHAVLVLAGHHERLLLRGPDVLCQPRCHLGVARQDPQHGAAVAGRVALARLVATRHAGPRGHRGEQRQPDRRGRLERLGDRVGAERPDQRQRLRVARRQLGGPQVVDPRVRDVLDARQRRADRGGQSLRQDGVDAHYSV